MLADVIFLLGELLILVSLYHVPGCLCVSSLSCLRVRSLCRVFCQVPLSYLCPLSVMSFVGSL